MHWNLDSGKTFIPTLLTSPQTASSIAGLTCHNMYSEPLTAHGKWWQGLLIPLKKSSTSIFVLSSFVEIKEPTAQCRGCFPQSHYSGRKQKWPQPNSKCLSSVSIARSVIPKCLFVETAALLLLPPGVSWSKCTAVGREAASKSPFDFNA